VQIERVREPVVEERAIGQARQGIVERAMRELGLLRHDIEGEAPVVEHHDQLAQQQREDRCRLDTEGHRSAAVVHDRDEHRDNPREEQ
jgi:hypothetical protein